jgi:CheY-like chemotaxis protein
MMITAVRKILLVEDNADDVELTLAALEGNRVANEVVVVRDGAEALDYLYRRGPHADRIHDDPGLISRCRKWTAWKCCGR